MLFLINVVIAVATLWNTVEDHSEALTKLRSAVGAEKLKARRKLILLWLVPVLSLAAIPLTWRAETQSEMEIAELSNQTEEAKKESASANEHAAKLDLARVELEKEVVSLKLKLKPRIITQTQITNFIFLTEKIAKMPVALRVSHRGDDTASFAVQLRYMLDLAGFPPTIEGSGGIMRSFHEMGFSRPIGGTEPWVDVVLECGNDSLPPIRNFDIEFTNGFNRAIVREPEPDLVHAALIYSLKILDIKVGWKTNIGWIPPGSYEFMVLPKNN